MTDPLYCRCTPPHELVVSGADEGTNCYVHADDGTPCDPPRSSYDDWLTATRQLAAVLARALDALDESASLKGFWLANDARRALRDAAPFLEGR